MAPSRGPDPAAGIVDNGGQSLNGQTSGGPGGNLINVNNIVTDSWSAITFGTWFNLTGQDQGSNIQRLYSKANGTAATDVIFSLILDPNADAPNFTTRVVMNTNNGGTETSEDDNPGTGGSGVVSTGVWHYFAATWKLRNGPAHPLS